MRWMRFHHRVKDYARLTAGIIFPNRRADRLHLLPLDAIKKTVMQGIQPDSW